MKLINLLILLSIISLTSCSTTKEKESDNNQSSSTGQIIGNFQIIADGHESTDDCEVTLATENGEEDFSFGNGSELTMTLPAGKAWLESLTCQKGVFHIPVTHNFEENEIVFENNSGQTNYIGDVKINWVTKGPSPILFVLSIPLAYLAGGSTDKMDISVKDNYIGRVPASKDKNKVRPHTTKSLIKIDNKYNKNIDGFLVLAKEE